MIIRRRHFASYIMMFLLPTQYQQYWVIYTFLRWIKVAEILNKSLKMNMKVLFQ